MKNEETVQKNSLQKTKAAIVALCLLVSISAGFIGGWVGSLSYRQQNETSTEVIRQSIDNESEIIAAIADTVGDSVVSVNVVSEGTERSFFGEPRQFSRQSAGTGFILNKEGVVLTNRHVIPEGVTEVSVTLSDGTELMDVEVLGRTSQSDPLDIAFLKINDAEGKNLQPVQLGESSEMKVGQKVIAIGNALGQFQNTVTSGIISGFGRSIFAQDEAGTDQLQNLFQTDAAINQGNSGGPLVNINGEVIGVNTAVAGGGAENIGFAIPIDDIKGLIAGVLETGRVERPYLGVRYIQLNEDIALDLNLETTEGAYVFSSGDQLAVLEGSPAEGAGLQDEDIITAVEGVALDGDASLVTLIGRQRVGDEISLTIVRAGEEIEVTVLLEAADF